MFFCDGRGELTGFRAMRRGMATASAGINKYSKNITQPKSQGASQAMCMPFGRPIVLMGQCTRLG